MAVLHLAVECSVGTERAAVEVPGAWGGQPLQLLLDTSTPAHLFLDLVVLLWAEQQEALVALFSSACTQEVFWGALA